MKKRSRVLLRLAAAWIIWDLALVPLGAQVTVSIDTSPSGFQQVIDGFGTCLMYGEAEQSWWQQLYYDDLQASVLRVDLTPCFAAPYSDYVYNSPWYGNNPALPGPDNNNVRVYTNALDYTRLYAGRQAHIAVMGPDINRNTNCFNFNADVPRVAGHVAQAGFARANALGDFKLVGSLWSPAPWLKISSGNSISGMSGNLPVNGTPWPFIWGGNFSGGKLDVSSVAIAQFDDSALGGTGPTSALTQFARCTAAYLRGFQNAYGVKFYAISVQNELNFEEFYSSCIYPLSSQYLAAIKAVRTELDKYPDLTNIRLMGPEDVLASDNSYGMWQYGSGATETDKNLQFVQNIGADPAALSALDFFCIHGYEPPLAGTLQAWNAWAGGWTASPAPGMPSNVQGFTYYNKKSWLTESSGENPAWLSPSSGFPSGGAWSIAMEIHQALTTGQQGAYLYWQMTDGSPVGIDTLTDSSLRNNAPKYIAAKHFFRFIRPRSVRVNATVSNSSDLNASAYYHPDNQTLTLVLVNSSPAPVVATILVPSTPAGVTSFQAFTSSDGNYWQSSTVGVSGSEASISVPGYGIVTLYGAANEAPPSISIPPQSQRISACSTVSFTVAASGTGPFSYQWLKEGAPIVGATSTVLTLNNVQTNQAGNYSVAVSGFGTTTSQVAVLDVGPATNIPWEHGQAVNGFQDDFNAPMRNPSWIVSGAGGDYYKQGNGVLAVTVQNGDPNHLLYNATYDRTTQEVLARLRMPSVWSGSAPRAGIAAAVDASNSQGIDFLFRNTTQNGITGKQVDFLDDMVSWGSTGLPFQWNANTWYWMRLRHEPEANGGTDDVFAKVWPSDGITPEPENWQLSWNYSPNQTLRSGLAGMAASSWSSPGQGAFQVDYILIKASLLPNITVDTGVVPPAIVTQPQSQDKLVGVTASFNVQATGSSTLCYQWRLNNLRLTGATNSSLTLTNLQPAQAGSYSVVITNWAGSVTSAIALLTVDVPPTITMQPQSRSTIAGNTAIFGVQASGTAPLSWQWQFNGVNLVDDGRITGAQSSTLTIANALLADAGNYAVVVTNAYGSVASTVVTLSVLPATPVVTWPSPTAITYGTPLSADQLDATASVPGTFAYSPGTQTMLDAGTAVLTVLFTPSDVADFTTAGETVSLSVLKAPLTVTAESATRVYGKANPSFSGSMVGLVNGDAISATYTCAATSSSLPGNYPIVPLLVDPNTRQGNYQVTLLQGTLTVIPASAPTVLTIMPDSGLTNGGTSVSIVGTGFEDGATVNFGALRATSVTFISPTNLVAVTPPSGLGTIDVVITNADGEIGVLAGGFTYVGPPGTPPSIVLQPTNQVVTAGAGALFAVVTDGTPPVNYHWQFNGMELADDGRVTGSQSNFLAIADVGLADAGNYEALMNNDFGMVTSAVATLTVLMPPALQAVTQAGGSIVFTWNATPGQNYQVQYKTDLAQPNWNNLGSPVAATNSTAFASDALATDPQRFYRVLLLR